MTKNINIFTSKNNQHAMKLASYFWLGVLKISEFDYPILTSDWTTRKNDIQTLSNYLCVLKDKEHVSDKSIPWSR